MTVVAAVVLVLLGAPGPSLVVFDETGNQIVLCRQLEPSEEFILAYTHSMYGGDVRETFRVTAAGTLRRIAMRTAHPAAADYYAYTADVVREGDLYRIDVPAADFAAIAVRIDEVGAPRLRFADGEIDLLAATGNQHRVVLSGRPRAGTC
jgi:hypothetical protein